MKTEISKIPILEFKRFRVPDKFYLSYGYK